MLGHLHALVIISFVGWGIALGLHVGAADHLRLWGLCRLQAQTGAMTAGESPVW